MYVATGGVEEGVSVFTVIASQSLTAHTALLQILETRYTFTQYVSGQYFAIFERP